MIKEVKSKHNDNIKYHTLLQLEKVQIDNFDEQGKCQ